MNCALLPPRGRVLRRGMARRGRRRGGSGRAQSRDGGSRRRIRALGGSVRSRQARGRRSDARRDPPAHGSAGLGGARRAAAGGQTICAARTTPPPPRSCRSPASLHRTRGAIGELTRVAGAGARLDRGGCHRFGAPGVFESDGPFAYRVRASDRAAAPVCSRPALTQAGGGFEVLGSRQSKTPCRPRKAAEVGDRPGPSSRGRRRRGGGSGGGPRSAAGSFRRRKPRNRRREAVRRMAAPGRARPHACRPRPPRARRWSPPATRAAESGLLGQDPASAWPRRRARREPAGAGERPVALKKTKAAEEAASRVADDGTRPPTGPPLPVRPRPLRRPARRGTAPIARATRGSSRSTRLSRPHVSRKFRPPSGGERASACSASPRSREISTRPSPGARMSVDDPATLEGFESLWRLSWQRYRDGDYAGARERFEALQGVYSAVSISRRLEYWRARCLEPRGGTSRRGGVRRAGGGRAAGSLRAIRARTHAAGPRRTRGALGPVDGDGGVRPRRRALRLRMFEEAAAEARMLLPSRGRDLRWPRRISRSDAS